MIDVTLKHNGSYYLPYYSYPSKEQLRRAYPRIEEFLQKKSGSKREICEFIL